MATVRCPLCGGQHELETTTKGVPYVECKRWKQSVFFNRGEGEAYLKTVEATGDKEEDDEGYVVVD